MNRSIKFRAWDTRDKCWVYFKLEELKYSGYITLFHDRYEFENITQFTGLLDKNGKEVYEGDIVRGFKREQQKTEGYEVKERVYGGVGGFSLFSHPIQDFSYDDEKKAKWLMWRDSGSFASRDYYYEIIEIEVIGNIYENPELLK